MTQGDIDGYVQAMHDRKMRMRGSSKIANPPRMRQITSMQRLTLQWQKSNNMTLTLIDAALLVIALLALRSIWRDRRAHDREVNEARLRLYRGNL